MTEPLGASAVLLIDDTWTAGGHAQSAAFALRQAGAEPVALVVIGRHIQRSWQVTEDETSGDRFDALPRVFDWSTGPLASTPTVATSVVTPSVLGPPRGRPESTKPPP